MVADLQRLPVGRQKLRRDGTAVNQTITTHANVDECAKVCHVGDAARQIVAHSSFAQRRDAATKQRLAIIYNHDVATVEKLYK